MLFKKCISVFSLSMKNGFLIFVKSDLITMKSYNKLHY